MIGESINLMAFFVRAFLVLFGFFFCLPLSFKLTLRKHQSFTLISTASFGLSIGFLTLFMAYLATFYKPGFNLAGILIPLCLSFLLFSVLWLKDKASFQFQREEGTESVSLPRLDALLKWSIGIVCLFIFWNSIYYPFVTQDAITNYALPAKNIFLARGMDGFNVPQFKGIFDAYPLLVPLSYVYNYLVFGEINEHAAKLIPGLFSIGVIGSTYLLGEHLYSRRIALFAALLVAFTPLFLRFATSGYTDIPGAFFYTNAAFYCWLTYRYRSMKYAVLTGLMVGFSIWTKNSTFLIFISILVFFMIQILLTRERKTEGYIHLSHLCAVLGISLAIGGPWYLRNYLLFGEIVPTSWVHKAFWMHYGIPLLKYFGVIGYHVSIVYVFGLFYGLFWLSRRDTKTVFLLSFILPYLMVWVLKFSYDPRFLLMIFPLVAVLSIWAVGNGFQRILGSFSKKKLAAFILCGILIVPHIGYIAVNNRDLFLHPLMGDEEKRLKTMKRLYPLILYLKDIQSKAGRNIRIIALDTRVLYFLGPQMVSTVYPMKMEQLKDFDYFVYPLAYRTYNLSPEGNEISANLSNENYFINVFESGGDVIYKIIH